MHLFIALCLTALTSNLPKDDLAAHWKAVPLEQVAVDGRRSRTNVYDFACNHEDEGRVLARAMIEATQEVPAQRMSLFIQGLALPVIVEWNDEITELPKAKWVVHLGCKDLFAAEVDYLGAFVSAEALAFLRCPPVSDAERAKVSEQLDRVLEELRKQCDLAGFDMKQAEGPLRGLRRYLDALTSPGRYGTITVPQPDERVAQIMTEIGERFGRAKSDREQEARFIRDMGTWAFGRFRRTIAKPSYEPDSKEGDLMKALDRALKRRDELEKRLSTTQPAFAPPSATQPASTRPAQ